MDINLDELERLAKAATPGPWATEDLYNITHYDEAHEWHGIVIQADICGKIIPSEANAAYIVAACNQAPELVARVRELEERIAELTQENSGHKRVIHILENKVLELKEKPIPMEPRQFIPSSNRSNAKEAE